MTAVVYTTNEGATMEVHEFRFAGVWVPPHICELLRNGRLTARPFSLFIIIQALQGEEGCCASNKYLAAACGGVVERKIQEHVATLEKLGLVERIRFDGRRRYLRAVVGEGGVPKNGTSDLPKKVTPPWCNKVLKQGKKSTVPTREVGTESTGGFGMVTPEESSATKFDIAMAATLAEAVRAYGKPRKTGITRARPSTWANHLRLLRTRDGIPEEEICRVMTWYAAHIGEEFVPQAYSGTAFRRKFPAIEAAAGRDIAAVEVGPDAAKIAGRLSGMGWPAGCNSNVPAAVQTCLTAYAAWLDQRNAFVDKLRRDDLGDDYGNERERLLGLGEHLLLTMPAAPHFVQQWMEQVNQRVNRWDGWDGNFAPLLFKPDGKRFRSMGRAWAGSYTKDPDRWNRFIEVMGKELDEG